MSGTDTPDTPLTETSVVQCLSTAMELIRSVGKTGTNKQQNYQFRGIDATVNAASPAFRQVGVVVTPELRDIAYEAVEVGKNRSLMQTCKVTVAFTFHGPAGDHITAVTPGEAMDSGDKATAKAMSVAFRIALLQSLCIPTDDPDPDEHTYERSAARRSVSRATAKRMLVERLGQHGLDDDVAKAAAVDIWAAAGDPDGPFDDDALHELLARCESVPT